MSDFYNSHTDVGFLLLECGIFATQMSAFYNLNVGFLLLEYRIFATRTSDFHNLDVGFFTTRIWYFYYSDVGFLLHECGIFATCMDVGFLQLGCRILQLGCRSFTTQMAPTRSVDYIITRIALSCMLIYVIFGLSKLIDPLQKWLAI